jgi:hypothetical protein
MGLIQQNIVINGKGKFNKHFMNKRIKNVQQFDLLNTALNYPNNIYHVVLIASDNARDHSICINNNWIFDGNYQNTLKLNKENLNRCVQCTFMGIDSGYEYIYLLHDEKHNKNTTAYNNSDTIQLIVQAITNALKYIGNSNLANEVLTYKNLMIQELETYAYSSKLLKNFSFYTRISTNTFKNYYKVIKIKDFKNYDIIYNATIKREYLLHLMIQCEQIDKCICIANMQMFDSTQIKEVYLKSSNLNTYFQNNKANIICGYEYAPL